MLKWYQKLDMKPNIDRDSSYLVTLYIEVASIDRGSVDLY